MGELRDLYQEMILDHGKHPRNYGKLDDANHTAQGHNPLCGDRLTVWVRTEGNRISDVTFEGNGCAISMASASMMGEVLKGMRVEEAEAVFRRFHELVTGGEQTRPEETEGLGKLIVFSGVKEFPVRVKCATLAWHTLQAALVDKKSEEAVSTEGPEPS
jgi:nitrogen fixation NifU-like protein